MTATHTQFVTSLYKSMTDDVLAEFERLSGYDITAMAGDVDVGKKPQGQPMLQNLYERLPSPMRTILQERMPAALGGTSTGTRIDNVTIEVKEVSDMDAIEKFSAMLAQAESSGLVRNGRTNFRFRTG